jgi:hypothetical protein
MKASLAALGRVSASSQRFQYSLGVLGSGEDEVAGARERKLVRGWVLGSDIVKVRWVELSLIELVSWVVWKWYCKQRRRVCDDEETR